MNMYESIRDKRKLVEKLRWYTFKITYISTANYHTTKLGTKLKLRHCILTKMIKIYEESNLNIHEY